MSLHHMAHLSLASGYLMANMIPIGTLIAFLHDFSDIAVQAAKAAEGRPSGILVFTSSPGHGNSLGETRVTGGTGNGVTRFEVKK